MMLRDYEPGDLSAMHLLDVVCFERPFRFTRSAMRRFAEAAKARVVIAEVDGKMAGFGILHIEPANEARAGYVITLDVDPVYRRKGVAGKLMRQMEIQAAVSGCSMMALHVFAENTTAIAFYERMGYVLSHRARGFYGAGLHALVYRKGIAVETSLEMG